MADNNIPTFGAPVAPPITTAPSPPVSFAVGGQPAPMAPTIPAGVPMEMPMVPPVSTSVDLPPTTPPPSDDFPMSNPASGSDLIGASPAPEIAPPPIAGAAPPPPPPAPLKKAKKSLPLPAILLIVLGLIIIIGITIYFTLIQSMGQTSSPAPSSIASLPPLPSPSATPPMSSMAAVLASNFSRSLDVNCVAGADGSETIAYAEVPFILNQQVKQNFDLLLADGVSCLGNPGDVAGGAIQDQEGTRYVQLIADHDTAQLAYDQVFFVHEGSQREPGLSAYTDNVFDFPQAPACSGANMCYQLKDGTQMYFVTNQPHPFVPEQFCVALSNAGKQSDDETLLAKVYVGECVRPIDIPTLAAVYSDYGRADDEGVWQMHEYKKIGEFYAELSSAYQRLPNYTAMQTRLEELMAGIEL